MRMRTLRSVLLAGTMAVGFAGAAEAAPITGMINFSGDVIYNTTTATFISALVNGSASGSFLGLFTAGTSVTWTSPLTFSPSLSPTGLIWTVTEGSNTASFTAASGSGSVSGNSDKFLNISMIGTLSLTGFDDTPAQLAITAQFGGDGQTQVAWSATARALPVSVPEPASLALLGAGLLGLGLAARRRQAA